MQQNEDRVNDLKEDVESCSYRLKKKFSSNKNIDIQIISIQITILQVWFPDIPPPCIIEKIVWSSVIISSKAQWLGWKKEKKIWMYDKSTASRD